MLRFIKVQLHKTQRTMPLARCNCTIIKLKYLRKFDLLSLIIFQFHIEFIFFFQRNVCKVYSNITHFLHNYELFIIPFWKYLLNANSILKKKKIASFKTYICSLIILFIPNLKISFPLLVTAINFLWYTIFSL